MVKTQILIENEGIVYEPAVLDGIQWSTDRKGSPGKLTFTAVNDGILNVTEVNSASSASTHLRAIRMCSSDIYSQRTGTRTSK